MLKNKFFVDIGSVYTKVYSNIVLLKEPTCIILRSGGLTPKTVACGRLAELRKHLIAEDEQFINPVKEGAIMHFGGAVAMLKEYLKRAGVKKNSEITAYFPCSLSVQQRQDIEKVFIAAGYKNVALNESLLSLKPYIATYRNMAVVDIGGSRSDVGIINEDGIVAAYSINIGGATVTERIINTVERLYNLNISFAAAEKLKLGIGSLYDFDTSSMTVSGRDIITGAAKSVEVYASDIYEDIAHCYKRIIKIIEGLLVVAPLECIEGLNSRGIFALGGGSKMRGFDDFLYKQLALPLNMM